MCSTYFDAAEENTFKNVLGVVISQTLDNTTAQINFRYSWKAHRDRCACASIRPHIGENKRKHHSYLELQRAT